MSDPVTVAARAAADALRDRRALDDAAAAYAAHLRVHAGDRDGWIAYGDCMAGLGDPGAALLLWREAERLAPPDPALLQRLGDALAGLGRAEEACVAWARALDLDPARVAAREALLGAAPLAALRAAVATSGAPAPVPHLLLDLSDLLDYWQQGNRLPTGIQRMQIEVARAALDDPAARAAALVFDPTRGTWRLLPAATVRHLVGLAGQSADAADPVWRLAVAQARAALTDAALPQGATLINLGTSWWLPDYLRRVFEARRRHGLRYVAFLHDCIPLVLPEHCVGALVEEFARWFAGICCGADLVICNSRSTEADFLRLRASLAPGLAAPVRVVPLDAAPPRAAAPPAETRPFVLCVGTIESRKNHLMLFGAWLSLLRRHGAEAVPDLVCVGKRGWLAEAALALHANAPALRERVRLRHAVTDAELGALYAGCLFTVQNSHYEGWGLPVTESLAHGKVALVPDHSGYRESGAGGAVFFTPDNQPDLVAKLEALIFDAGFRADAETRLARAVRLRDWRRVADAILEAAGDLPDAVAEPPVGLTLGQALPLRLLPGTAPTLAMVAADLVRDGDGWHALEPWGVWTRPGIARLRLPLGLDAPEPLRLHLALRGVPEAVALTLRVGGGVARRTVVAADAPAWLTLELPAQSGGELLVEIDSGEGTKLGTGRPVGIGIVALMVCRTDDLLARADWFEQQALPSLVRL